MEHVEEWNEAIFRSKLNMISLYALPIKLENKLKRYFKNINYIGIKDQIIAQYFFPDEAM